MTIVWMGWERAGLKALAALVIAVTIALTLVMLLVDVPAPQALACTTSHVPGGDKCVRLTCGSVVEPSLPAAFARKRGASPSAAETCDAAYRSNRFRAMAISIAGALLGTVLIKQSSRRRFSEDIEKPTIET